MSKGLFITLEGPECSGKSTQREFIAEYYRNQGREVVLTREPGGTPIAERIRDITKTPNEEPLCTTAELLLMYAARAQHIDQVISPALNRGAVVVCDRFNDSSWAYQHYARGVPEKALDVLSELVVSRFGLVPDLTLVIFVTVETLLKRKGARSGVVPDRFDDEKKPFMEAVLYGYKDIIKRSSHHRRIRQINGEESIEDVSDQIRIQLANLDVSLAAK